MEKRGPKPKRKEVVWSADIAYAVGLMATDGCLSNDGRHLELTSKDAEQLENFMKCIERKITISTKFSTYSQKRITRIQFSDIVLYEFFLSVGLTPHKTHTIGELNIPDEFFFDFLRGHHDGDGSFHSYYDPRWKSSFMFYLIFASASMQHILWIREKIFTLIGVRGHITTSRNSKVVQLKYAKAEGFEILKRMYSSEHITCLSRKRLKIEEALRIVDKSLVAI